MSYEVMIKLLQSEAKNKKITLRSNDIHYPKMENIEMGACPKHVTRRVSPQEYVSYTIFSPSSFHPPPTNKK